MTHKHIFEPCPHMLPGKYMGSHALTAANSFAAAGTAQFHRELPHNPAAHAGRQAHGACGGCWRQTATCSAPQRRALRRRWPTCWARRPPPRVRSRPLRPSVQRSCRHTVPSLVCHPLLLLASFLLWFCFLAYKRKVFQRMRQAAELRKWNLLLCQHTSVLFQQA